jgi:outer membrane protein TolC
LAEAVAINEKLNQAAEVGRGPVLQARLEQSQVSIAKKQAEIDVAAKTRILSETLAIAVDQVDAFGNDEWPTDVSNDSTAIAVSSPELAQARAIWESSKCELRRADVEIVPNINTQASVQQDAISRNTIVGIQVGVALPVTDRKIGLVQAARSEVARLQADWSARERQVLARVAEAIGEYNAAREMVQQIDTTLLEMARERLSLAQQAHEQGEIDYLELLTAQRSFLMIQQTAIDAQEQAAQARVRLETLVVEAAP